MAVAQVIATYTGRWNIETTFQEMRAYLGLETTRGRTKNTVLRAAPCLFGLYSVDRKSTRLNSSHSQISYAVFCLKKKKKIIMSKAKYHTPQLEFLSLTSEH